MAQRSELGNWCGGFAHIPDTNMALLKGQSNVTASGIKRWVHVLGRRNGLGQGRIWLSTTAHTYTHKKKGSGARFTVKVSPYLAKLKPRLEVLHNT